MDRLQMKLAESSSMESTCATRARLSMRIASIRSQIGRVDVYVGFDAEKKEIGGQTDPNLKKNVAM